MKGVAFVVGGAVGMVTSLVMFILGGVFVGAISKNAENEKKETKNDHAT